MNGSNFLFDPSWETDAQQYEDTNFRQTSSYLVPSTTLSPPVINSNPYTVRRYGSNNHFQRQAWRIHSAQNVSNEPGAHLDRSLRRVPHPLRSNDRVSKAPARDRTNLAVRKTRQGGQTHQNSSISSLASNVSNFAEHSIGPAASSSSTQSFFIEDPRSHHAAGSTLLPIIEPTYGLPSDGTDISNKEDYLSGRTQPSHYEIGDYEEMYTPQPYAGNIQFSNQWDLSANPGSAGMGYYGLPNSYELNNQEQWMTPTTDQHYPTEISTARRTFSLREPLPTQLGRRPARKHFTPEVTNILKTWFKENSSRPYPSEETKQELLRETGLTMNQLSNWFINARRRNWRRPRPTKE